MRELFARLARAPGATARLLLASLVINGLGLASSLYVIQVLNRYVSYGVGATLASLAAGAVMAVIGEHLFRQLRLAIAEDLVGDQDERLGVGLYGLSLTCRLADLERYPPGARAELLRSAERVEAALGPSALAALADLPYSLLFLAALLLLAPPLALVVTGFGLLLLLLAWGGQRAASGAQKALIEASGQLGALVLAGVQSGETVRQFRAAERLVRVWRDADRRVRGLRRQVGRSHQTAASLSQMIQALTGVAVIGAGALLVVAGRLDVGALIGANILAARALAPLSRLIPLAEAARGAAHTLTEARRFAGSVVEPTGTKILPGWGGRIAVHELACLPPAGTAPLFSALSFSLESGGVLVVTGRNGSGKSSLLRLLAGLLPPTSGQVLVDGVDLAQLVPDWWRRQVSYLPQEPVFLDGPIRQSLLDARPDASPERIDACLTQAGLRALIDRHPLGLDQPLGDGGRTLAPGLRRRLALARALLVDGPLVLLDEPSEGLDREGAELVYAQLIALARRGKTLVVVTHDPVILRGARLVLRFEGGEPELVQSAGAAP